MATEGGMGAAYMGRTYYRGGRYPMPTATEGYYYGGGYYYGYVSPYYYAPAYYGWAWQSVACHAGRLLTAGQEEPAPWYGYWRYYFNPYPAYATAALWMTDYGDVISQNLQAAYEAQAAANANVLQQRHKRMPGRNKTPGSSGGGRSRADARGETGDCG